MHAGATRMRRRGTRGTTPPTVIFFISTAKQLLRNCHGFSSGPVSGDAVRLTESRAARRNAFSRTQGSKGRDSEQGDVLQPQEASFNTGLRQPHGLREESACSTRVSRSMITWILGDVPQGQGQTGRIGAQQ